MKKWHFTVYAQLSSEARSLGLHLIPYFVYASKDSSDETMQKPRHRCSFSDSK